MGLVSFFCGYFAPLGIVHSLGLTRWGSLAPSSSWKLWNDGTGFLWENFGVQLCVQWLCEEGKHTFTACVLLPMSVSSDGMGGRAPSTIFRYSSAPSRRMLIQSNIVNCVSRSRDSISGRRLLSQTAFSNAVVVAVAEGLCGVGVTTFVDADAARAAPRSATCSILPARPRSRENHARTLFQGCDASLEAPEEEDECGTVSTASIFG